MNSSTYAAAMNKLCAQAYARFSPEYIANRLKMTGRSADDMHSGNDEEWRKFVVQTTARWINLKRKQYIIGQESMIRG